MRWTGGFSRGRQELYRQVVIVDVDDVFSLEGNGNRRRKKLILIVTKEGARFRLMSHPRGARFAAVRTQMRCVGSDRKTCEEFGESH